MIDAFVWWLAVELLGVIALPFTFALFSSLPDRGYALGKALAILIVSYILWLAASAHILPNTRWAIILIIVLFALGSLFLFWRRRHELRSFISENRKVIIATEAIFLLSFVLLAVVRAYNPEILFGEKPMDFAFLNGILRSEYFPPHDPWLSGHSISYYYFGYLMMATLTKLTGVASSVSFNLSLALLFALAAIGVFSILYNLVKLRRGGFKAALGLGLVAVGFLLILGNLEGVLELFHAHGLGSDGFWGWVGIKGLDSPYHSGPWYPTDHWWWWRATRVIDTVVDGASLDYTITEFPFFSFIFADLHPHLMALPFALLNLGFCLELMSSSAPLGLAWLRRNWPKFLVLAVSLGALGFISTWDLPTYIFLFALAAVVATYLARGKIDHRLAADVGLFCLALVACAVLFYLPFYLGLETQVKGIAPVGDIDTRPFHFFIIWGFFIFVTLSFILAQGWGVLKGRGVSWRGLLGVILVPLLSFVVWVVWRLAAGADFLSVLDKFGHILPLFIVLWLVLLIIIKKSQSMGKLDNKGQKASLFALLLLFTGFLLLMGCELFFLRDLFYPWRMNTVFKLYYQAWLLLAIASAFSLYFIGSRWRPATLPRKLARVSWWLVCAVLVVGSLIYPIAATITFTDGFRADVGEPTLDGLAFVQRSNPSEYEAIAWLNSEVSGAPVIVEATGGYFTDYFRVSARTGLPTILGCPGHELQWHGSEALFLGREEDINLIYESEDISQVQGLLGKYQVTYVYIGHLEREQYGDAVGEKFADFMDVAFENEGVTIYKVRNGDGEG